MIDRKFRIARKWSNECLKKYAYIFDGDIVNISAWNDYDKCGEFYRNYFINASNYYTTNYGEGFMGSSDKNDELILNLEKPLDVNLIGKYNTVFNHTTLEHIYNFQLAFKNLCLLATDAVIIVVPFSQIQHTADAYKDYWRFTPFAIKKLFEDNNYTMVVCEHNNDFNAAIYLLCIGINNKKFSKYASIFSEYIIDENYNLIGDKIGVDFKQKGKKLRRKK